MSTRFARLALAIGIASLHLAMLASAFAKAPLADAVEHRDVELIRHLLEKKAEVNAPQADGMTALHWAAHYDNARTVECLIAAGANPKATNHYGITPLTLACINGNTEVVEMLLDAGADADCSCAGGETALMTASRTGRLGPVNVLLSHGADVNARELKKQTALMWAAAEGNLEVVDALLKKDADFRTPLPSGFTPFFFAVREGRTNVAMRLIQAGADINGTMQPEKGSRSPVKHSTNSLLLAVENGHFELAAKLLEAGADPNARPAGYTALHAITWVRKPIRGDGNPPPVGSGNMTSLEIVQQLVAHGADNNAKLERGASGRGRLTTTGSTPFLLAARASDLPLMKLLLELGSNSSTKNVDNTTPLLAATGVGALDDGEETAGTEEEAIEAVRMLLDRGADVNAVDDNRETAMHGAAYQSRSKLVQLLADRGANINVWNQKNMAGWTPLMISQGHRPGNFRPAPETIAAFEQVMRAAGVLPKDSHDIREGGYKDIR
jgi:ankyrin repeat protein